jgi:hypothetical protein
LNRNSKAHSHTRGKPEPGLLRAGLSQLCTMRRLRMLADAYSISAVW